MRQRKSTPDVAKTVQHFAQPTAPVLSDRWVLRRRCDLLSRAAPIDATAVRSEDELRRAASGVSGRCKRYEGPARPYLLGYGCCCQLPLVYRLANTRRAAMQSVAAVEAASVL